MSGNHLRHHHLQLFPRGHAEPGRPADRQTSSLVVRRALRDPQAYGSHHPTRTGSASESAIIAPSIRIYDPWFLLGAVAGATKRLKIGTAICIVPLNNPLILARHTVTAHDISGGRFLFGTGAGWLREEFDALGVPFNERGARLDETIEILRKAWAGGYFAHAGKHFRFDSLQISPRPVKVPLVCGGNTGPALRRVAEVADAWINSAMVTLPGVGAAAMPVSERERTASGTASRAFQYFLRPHTVDPEDVGGFVSEGFENLILWGPNVWPNTSDLTLDEKVAGLERVARDLGVTAPVRT